VYIVPDDQAENKKECTLRGPDFGAACAGITPGTALAASGLGDR
jgi:hypothetical protein